MTNSGHLEGGRVTKPLSRRQEKKAAKKAERAKSSRVCATKDGAIRNSRAGRFQHIVESPGRGGLTAKGADQLQRYFSNNIPEAGKPSVGEMDESAAIFMLQMAAEEVDAGGSGYDVPKQMTKKSLMAKGADDRNGGEEDEELEEGMEGGMLVEAKESPALQEEQRLGDGVALANDFKLCIRSKKSDGAELDGDL